jgi:phosphohistidine phosphatase SixA
VSSGTFEQFSQVLNRRDQEILNGLLPEPTPTSTLKTVIVDGKVATATVVSKVSTVANLDIEY